MVTFMNKGVITSKHIPCLMTTQPQLSVPSLFGIMKYIAVSYSVSATRFVQFCSIHEHIFCDVFTFCQI